MWGIDPLYSSNPFSAEGIEDPSAKVENLTISDTSSEAQKESVTKKETDSPLSVLHPDSDIKLPDTSNIGLSWVFTRQEQEQLDAWWLQASNLKRGRPSKQSQLGLPTDTRTVLGPSGKLRLRLTEWIEKYYKMNLREFSDLTGFPYNQLLYWNQGRSTPTMVRFYALMGWFKEGDMRDFFQLF
ncbi:MAG: hypothetical protein H2174_10420 [Vampirovibrio sp.]|nr:hypothetical protein [Vampirovibrio sp.]